MNIDCCLYGCICFELYELIMFYILIILDKSECNKFNVYLLESILKLDGVNI